MVLDQSSVEIDNWKNMFSGYFYWKLMQDICIEHSIPIQNWFWKILFTVNSIQKLKILIFFSPIVFVCVCVYC